MGCILHVIFSWTLNSFRSVMSLNALEKLYPQNNVLEVELSTLEIMPIL